MEDNLSVGPSDAISSVASELSKESVIQEVQKVASAETVPAIHSYQIKPVLSDKFKSAPVKEIIRAVLTEKFNGRTYDPDNVKKWTVEVANEVSSKIIELKMKRYKHVVQVILGEEKGAGVKSGVRCLWDSETDAYTSELFTNDTIFCLVVVYAIYLY